MTNLDSYSLALISRLGYHEGIVVLPEKSGGNNKVFILEWEGMPKYILKQYFRHPLDQRDRFGAEWMFLNYADSVGVSCVPKPIVCDPEQGIAIMEYIPGHKISSDGLQDSHVMQAIEFIEALNIQSMKRKTGSLSPASEACFSMRDHLESVERRIGRLKKIRIGSGIDHKAEEFVRLELIPLWEEIKTRILALARDRGIDLDIRLAEGDTIVSPSDFGFHNAIESSEGRVFFIDFEYAGMDDPVKMIADFFCQPSIPVPLSYLPAFATCVLGRLENPERDLFRLQMLFPVHALKWCCIMLNEFLPVGEDRRRFADGGLDINEVKKIQLNKARTFYSTIEKRRQDVESLLKLEALP